MIRSPKAQNNVTLGVVYGPGGKLYNAVTSTSETITTDKNGVKTDTVTTTSVLFSRDKNNPGQYAGTMTTTQTSRSDASFWNGSSWKTTISQDLKGAIATFGGPAIIRAQEAAGESAADWSIHIQPSLRDAKNFVVGVAREAEPSPAKAVKRMSHQKTACIFRFLQIILALLLGSLVFLTACGSGDSSNPSPPHPPSTITSVTVAPGTGQLRTGDTLTFTTDVKGTGPFNRAVNWLVDGIAGGDATHGTITSQGVYTAPASAPDPDPVMITATSAQDKTKSGNAAAAVYSLVVTPSNPTVPFGHSQQFTAQVIGLDSPTVQFFMKAGFGHITIDGLFTAPTPSTDPTETDTITVIVVGGGSSVDTNISIVLAPPVLTSITPNAASAWETVTIDGQDLYGAREVFFPGPLGSTLKADIQSSTDAGVVVTVPLGAVDGPVYMTLQPPGGTTTTNSLAFTRLPNLRIRATNKELSSGETVQFTFATLGASSPNTVTWTKDIGHVSPTGLYRAPVVTEETFAKVTGCLDGTRSCDQTMLRILPLRISPSQPSVNIGDDLQLQAIDGSPVSADWSVLAGGGSVTSGGLFTAPTDPAQAGAVPVSATAGGTSGTASIAVTGAFPGIVSRTNDYMDFRYDPKKGYLQTLEGTGVNQITLSGNRLYTLDRAIRWGSNAPPFFAIESYDITDPGHPTWLGAAEAITPLPVLFSAYSHYVFEVDSGLLAANQPSRIALYDAQSNTPTLVAHQFTPDMGEVFTNDGVIYGVPLHNYTGSTVPIYAYDIRGGTIQAHEYDVTPPAGAAPGISPFVAIGTGSRVFAAFTGNGETLFASYDISTSPPTLLGAATLIGSFLSGYDVLIRGNLLFFANEIFDISQAVPGFVGSAQVQSVRDVQGNWLLGTGFQPIYAAQDNYVVVDVSNPSNPVTKASLYAIGLGVLTPDAQHLITDDDLGGFATIDLSALGGMIDKARIAVFPSGFVFDHTINNQFLYVAGESAIGSGGMQVFDMSSGTPVFSGIIQYGLNAGLAVQVQGTTAFLGLADTLKTVDVTNATNPVETHSLAIPTNALALSGHILFDGTRDNHLIALDVSNPNNPSTLSIVSLPSSAITLRLVGSKLFVSDGPAGFLIFDVSNPAAPVQLGQLTLSTPIWDAAVAGDLAFLAADASGLVVADISNPLLPTQISTTVLESWDPFPEQFNEGPRSIALSVTVQNGLVYVGTANSLSLVFGFDCSQPAYPRLVSMNAFGEFIDSLISGFSFAGNDILVFGGLGAETGIVQADASLPRNAINLYYPPMNFRKGFGPDRKSKVRVFIHPKFDRELLQRKHRYLTRKRAWDIGSGVNRFYCDPFCDPFARSELLFMYFGTIRGLACY